jgi:hypothetical protein
MVRTHQVGPKEENDGCFTSARVDIESTLGLLGRWKLSLVRSKALQRYL